MCRVKLILKVGSLCHFELSAEWPIACWNHTTNANGSLIEKRTIRWIINYSSMETIEVTQIHGMRCIFILISLTLFVVPSLYVLGLWDDPYLNGNRRSTQMYGILACWWSMQSRMFNILRHYIPKKKWISFFVAITMRPTRKSFSETPPKNRKLLSSIIPMQFTFVNMNKSPT